MALVGQDTVGVAGRLAERITASDSMSVLSKADTCAFPGDTLRMTLPAGCDAPVADTVTAADIFGPSSFVPVGEYVPADTGVVTDAGYAVLVVVLLLFYMLMMLRYGGAVWRMVRMTWGRDDASSDAGDGDMPGAEVQTIALACGLLMFGVAVIRLCDMWCGNFAGLLDGGGGWLAALAVMAVILLAMGVQKVLLDVSASLTFNRGFVSALCARRMSLFASMAVGGTPAVVLMALSDGIASSVFATLFVVVTAAHLTLYVLRSFWWFVGQKVSILFWILYLCAVEVMPVGILVTVLLRSRTV